MHNSVRRKYRGEYVTYSTEIKYLVKVDWKKVLLREGEKPSSSSPRWLQCTFENKYDIQKCINTPAMKYRHFSGLHYVIGAPVEALHITEITRKWNTRDRNILTPKVKSKSISLSQFRDRYTPG